jgi:hypothetical protein
MSALADSVKGAWEELMAEPTVADGARRCGECGEWMCACRVRQITTLKQSWETARKQADEALEQVGKEMSFRDLLVLLAQRWNKLTETQRKTIWHTVHHAGEEDDGQHL